MANFSTHSLGLFAHIRMAYPLTGVPTAMPAHIDLLSTAQELVNQPPPPSLREILGAYRAKGDGDRDMLLAMLNAKTAEEQCHANRTALCRALVEAQPYTYPPSPMHEHYYPTPSTSVHSPPQSHSLLPSKREHHYHHRSHSPYTLAPMNDSRKRHRSSQSPPRHPPSPYYSPVSSSSSLTDSPRSSRPSMAIGALLSSNSSKMDPIKQADVSDERSKTRDYPMSS